MIDETGGGLLAAQLVAEGVEAVFLVPGLQLDWAVDGFARRAPALRLIHTRHEQAAAYLADGYARSSGRVGVFLVVPGPGILNASAALATAWACSSPVVAIVAAVPTRLAGRGLGALHEIDGQSEIVARLSKWHAIAQRASRYPGVVVRGDASGEVGPAAPVVLEIPADLFAPGRGGRTGRAAPAAADPG